MHKCQVLIAEPNVEGFHQQSVETLEHFPGLKGFQVNLCDNAVSAGAGREFGESPYTVMLSLWLAERETSPWRTWQQLRESLVGDRKASAYLVEEAEPLADASQRAAGERTPGFSQLALLRCPSSLSYQDWLSHWKTTHTQVAIETQATFRYVQNRVLAALSEDAPQWDAIVEECFPEAAMSSDEAFYHAVGDPVRCGKNRDAMMASCMKFIDFEHIAVRLSSEYRYMSAGR